ncbi:glutathione peroxidase [Roseomonas terrae]|uniref:Glutathione peroxidase n=1 Tax=Neoroseomonas terrae TaxID=424799 RepID=A0ABS5EDQ2_9PROT|nr:glutathione peroxidase [Neoroseomonas terrae]MBR0649147.1 glutathione peroxidase [Neoroseomonas terrae]
MSIDDIEAVTIDGRRIALSDYAGRALLVVNVASRCGFTPQYDGLEALHRRYAPRGLSVLGFPCNQFGAQEPGDEATIRGFCDTRFGVTFDLFAKVEVNGRNAHPLFRALKAAAPGLLRTQAIKWNFTKFLVDPARQSVRRYAPQVPPDRIAPEIAAMLP